MVPELYSKIVRKLGEKTKTGEINWQKTSVTDVFLVNFKEFSLTVRTSYDQEGSEYVIFTLLDPNGKIADSFPVLESDEHWGNFVFELYRGARRKALRIDEAVKTISKELGVDDDNEVPF